MAQVSIDKDLEPAALSAILHRSECEVVPAQALFDLVHVVQNVLALASAATVQNFDLDRAARRSDYLPSSLHL